MTRLRAGIVAFVIGSAIAGAFLVSSHAPPPPPAPAARELGAVRFARPTPIVFGDGCYGRTVRAYVGVRPAPDFSYVEDPAFTTYEVLGASSAEDTAIAFVNVHPSDKPIGGASVPGTVLYTICAMAPGWYDAGGAEGAP